MIVFVKIADNGLFGCRSVVGAPSQETENTNYAET